MSFQPLDSLSQALPPNAVQETGGNLDSIASSLIDLRTKMSDLTQELTTLKRILMYFVCNNSPASPADFETGQD